MAVQNSQIVNNNTLKLKDGDMIHGFIIDRHEDISEVDGCAWVMHHELCGTPLLWIANDDDNKSFSIAFKTPPADNTGVFHILEHSVLCGSDKYPVKEPFVDLLKTSMQTFLNALTYPDKTCYPVATTNEQDLLNLMDVYLDAVLHPQLYRKRSIFEQEGWHVEIDSDGTPYFNGVVYNEMKGANSDPDSVILNGLCEALFPQTAYRFESGGDPRAIPTLSYEDYLDTHARHYNMRNARIVLYGDISLDRELELINSHIMQVAQKQAGSINPLELQPPVITLDHTRTMETSPENASIALGYVFGTYKDRTSTLAADVLVDALLGSNEAPLKYEILQSGLGCDVDAFVYNGVLQPFIVLELRGAQPGSREAFIKLVQEAFEHYAKEGVPRENLEAALESATFTLRERDMGYADGVVLASNVLSGWLYDETMATDYLHFEDDLAILKEGLKTSYWEDFVQSALVDSKHYACCELLCVESMDEKDPLLENLAATLTESDKSVITQNVEELRRIQAEPDSKEAQNTLPRLALSDIGPGAAPHKHELVDASPLPCYYHSIPTRRINYVYHYFNLNCLTWDELLYAKLASTLFGKLATASHTAAQLDTLLEARLGKLTFATYVLENYVTHVPTPKIIVSASSLAENTLDLALLPAEVWSSTDFSDLQKIKIILQQQRIDLEQSFAASGNSYALARAHGYTSKTKLLAQHFGGVDYYRFVCSLLDSWDSVSPEIPAKLASICSRVFCIGNDFHSFTGDEADLHFYWDNGKTLSLATPTGDANTLVIPEPQLLCEGFVIPSDVSFAAMACDPAHTGSAYSGNWQVASRILSYDYLWNTVRVQGGAYGCGFSALPHGSLAYYTYRDPHPFEALKTCREAGSWLANKSFDETEFTGYIVSTVAHHDAPQKPYHIAQREDSFYLTDFPQNWRETIRSQELSCTPDALQELVPALNNLAARGAICIFGNRETLEAGNLDLKIIDLIRNDV